MGENLVLELDSEWAPEQYHDEYVTKLVQVVEAKKRAGDVKTLTGVVAEEIVPAQGADIIDLTELLRRSLRGKRAEAAEQTGHESASKRRRSTAANDAGEHPVEKAAAKKASAKAATTVKPVRRKRA